MSDRQIRARLSLIFFTFLALCIGSSLRTPYATPGVYVGAGLQIERDYANVDGIEISDIGAPDERAHVYYIRHLAGGQGFPEFRIGDGEEYENHQPPLYYLIAAPIQMASRGGEGFVLRLLSTVLGLIALSLVFRCARYLTTDSGALWITAIAGLLPSFIALCSAVSNDPLLVVWYCCALLVCLEGARDGWTRKRLILLGAICGLALLTKTSALALVAFCMVAVLVSAKRAMPKKAILGAAGVLLIAMAISSPWMMRNNALYGDPLGLKIFTQGFENSPKADMFIQAYGGASYLVEWVGWWTLRSVFGVYGYAMLFLPTVFYVVGGAVVALSVFGGVWWQRTETDETRRHSGALCWLLFAVVFAGFLRFNMTYFQAQARYLLPALAPISVGLGLGLSKFRLVPVFVAFLLVLNIYALWRLGPAFAAISR